MLVLGFGTYQNPGKITIAGRRRLIGLGTRPVLTSTLAGTIVEVDIGAVVSFEHLEVSGATGASGLGIEIKTPSSGASVRLIDSALLNNQVRALQGTGIELTVLQTEIANNRAGLFLRDSRATISNSIVAFNTDVGLDIDNGIYEVNNSFVHHNGEGIVLFTSNLGSLIQFTTVVDNAIGFRCDGSAGAHPNNIIARNSVNTDATTPCTFPTSMITNDVTPLRFVSPDTAPFDYHIQAGSSAIDAAGPTTLTEDFDGELRPAGVAADVGADELP